MMLRFVRCLLGAFAIVTGSGSAGRADAGTTPAAPYRPITVEEVIATRPITGSPPRGFLWSPHGYRYVYRLASARDGAPSSVRVVDAASGSDRELLAAKSSARGTRSRPIEQIAWAPDDERVAIVDAGTLEVLDVRGGPLVRIGPDADDPQFSPDGSKLAFVRDGNLYVTSLRGRGTATRQLTFDGSSLVLDGDPDWLYSEELDVDHAYAWSPKSDAIAYLRFDDSPVAPFPIQTYGKTLNAVEEQRYPLAGAANPHVSLHVASLSGATHLLYDGAPKDEYLVSFAWTAGGDGVIDQILDRAQKHARFVRFDADGGAARTIATETEPHFVDVQPAPRVLRDGRSMLVLSERMGVQGLDRIDLRTGRGRRLTGAIPIASLLGVDEHRRIAYVLALAPTRRDRSLFAVSLDRTGSRDLTPGGGTHVPFVPAHGGTTYIDAVSNYQMPLVIRRLPLTGRARAVTLFTTPSLAGRGVATTSAVTIPSSEGPLDGALTLPADFDPKRRYPVIVTVYGGPLPVGDHGSDAWPGLENTLYAQRGILTLNVQAPAERDERAAYERTYAGEMGRVAIAGPLAAARWLSTQSYVDASRLGLFGWSYGGYLTAFTMTHSHVFRAGIAGAPPTDWRSYDTAYTERYLGKPQSHAAAYRRSAVIPAASHLAGSLLIIHGSSDDNVHLANTVQFVNAAVEAGRPVREFIFPGARHGPTGIPAMRYLDHLMLDWFAQTLLR